LGWDGLELVAGGEQVATLAFEEFLAGFPTDLYVEGLALLAG
jgi:hypothetical protein